MARLTAALCLSCASAMSYHNPVKAPQRTGTSFLPANCRVATQRKQTKIRRTHASREKRAARHYEGAPAPLRGAMPHLPRPSRRLPGEKSGSSASRPRRPRARCERSPRERWVLSRHAASFFSWREPVAAHTSERSPGARESGKKRTKVTRNAPRRIPRSSAPRPATRSSRASSKKTRRTRGRTSMISRRRSARAP